MESSGRPILVVEDDAGMRNSMAELLRAAGFKVAAFASAEEFLATAVSPSAACLILDVHLPGLSGFELYEQVRPSTGEPPVIFITAHDTPATRSRSERLGAVAYLPKPFAGRRLLDALSNVTARG
jgi:FixJ family two-component response regulator